MNENVCPKCGTTIAEGVTTCPTCGCPLDEPATVVIPEQQLQQNEQVYNTQPQYQQPQYNQAQYQQPQYNQAQNQQNQAVQGTVIPNGVDPSWPEKSKVAAGLLGIFLGTFGVQKFYMGQVGMGVLMLLVSLLSCFILSPFSAMYGLVEGIIILTKSDEEFMQQYHCIVKK